LDGFDSQLQKFIMARPLVRSRSRKTSALLPESLRDGMMRAMRLALGGLVMAFAAGMAFALLSYDPRDPSWDTALSADTARDLHNLCGAWGAYSADILWQFFGLGCFLMPFIIAAWGWRIASDKGLEMLGWRCLTGLCAMLALSTSLGALGFSLPLNGAIRDGALGKIAGGGLAGLLPHPWGRIFVVPFFAILAIVALYLACALTFDEWHFIARLLHGVATWLARQAHRIGHAMWRMLHHEGSNLDEEDDDLDQSQEDEVQESDERAEEEVEEEEGFEIRERDPGEPPAPKAAKSKGPLIKRPAASARQARLALRPESDQKLPPLDVDRVGGCA
jgi:DNA segregation ATPase FtsK/SpoIIIE-like protein